MAIDTFFFHIFSELVEVWMNSVHSCAPPDNEIMNSKAIPPPVILVGTHADAIQQVKYFFLNVSYIFTLLTLNWYLNVYTV